MSGNRSKPEATGHVYFVEMLRPRLIKIGYARDIRARLATLKTSSPFDLDLLAYFNGTQDDERLIHAELSEHAYAREWFRPHHEVQGLIGCLYGFQADVARSGTSGPLRCDLRSVSITGFWTWREGQVHG